MRQKDLAKQKAKDDEEKRKKNSEKQQVADFLTSMEEDKADAITHIPVPETVAVAKEEEEQEGGADVLAGFFSELTEVSKEKERIKEEKSNQARELLLTEKYTTQDLGTGKAQYERLTQTNYLWKNQNPYAVMQLGVDATEEDIKYRYYRHHKANNALICCAVNSCKWLWTV